MMVGAVHSQAWKSLSDKVALKQGSQGNKDEACGILGGCSVCWVGLVGWRGLNEWESGGGRGLGDGEITMSLKDQGGVSFVFSARKQVMRGFPVKW